MTKLVKRSYICSNTESNGKKYYYRVGEIVVFDGDDGSNFSCVKLYANPNERYSVFADDKDKKYNAPRQEKRYVPEEYNLPF